MSPAAIFSNTLHTAAIAALESLINQALKLDLSTLARLQQLQGHVFALHCTAPLLSLYLIPTDAEVRLCGQHEGDCDTTLSGSASEFLKLATAADPASALINGELTLQGNSQSLIELQKILKQLDVDWELPLTHLFGDIVGHAISKDLRRGFAFGLQALKGFKRQMDEFIVEESDLLPARWQADKLFNDVDHLAMRTERFEARLQQLQSQLNQQPQAILPPTRT
ncbi:MAG: ubiquinone biosynthesis protein UbiJ [Oceanicoccus sp.]|jgi:ubiquinone biosynthesis protein UbiJ